jgi:stearoyl-CoA desaturase (delta-9 desaturase)
MIVAILAGSLSGWFTILCLSIYAHRSIAHRSVILHPAIAHLMRFWLWFSTGASTRAWVAVHRKHHAFVDRNGDPHSPVCEGLLHIVFFGYWYYRREARDADTVSKYGYNCPEDWVERRVYAPLSWLGLLALLGTDLFLFGIPGFVTYSIQLSWEALWAAGVINGFGPAYGYRNFDTRDASRNIVPFGILVAGEELHNNHHRWPRSAKFSMRRREIDSGWLFIWALVRLGLARDIYIRDEKVGQHIGAEPQIAHHKSVE